jgi:hypothetical protein
VVAKRSVPSGLLTRVWHLPSVGRVRLTRPSTAQLAMIDSVWPALRNSADWHHSWRWQEIAAEKAEVFAAVGPNDQVLGIWCSAKRRPIRLPAGPFYRPDYLELVPTHRGAEAGVFLFLLVVARALEVGAQGIVLGTWDVLRGFYLGLGGVEGKPRGWNIEPNLIPFTFDADTLEGLREALDRMEVHGQGTTKI